MVIRVFGTSRSPDVTAVTEFELSPLDVRDQASVESCVAEVLRRASRLDVLINNAGYGLIGFLEETSTEEAQAIFDTNFFGVVRMTNAVLPHLRAQGGGQIINIGSMAGLVGTPSEGMYSATKFALEGYTETLWREVRRFNVSVSLIEPGDCKTPFALNSVNRPLDDYRQIYQPTLSARAAAMTTAADPTAVVHQIARLVEKRSRRHRHLVGREKWELKLISLLPEAVCEWIARRYFRLDQT